MPAAPRSDGRPPILRDVGIDQRLNQQVPLDLTFNDETGKAVKLGEFFGSKPVVLSLVYYDCPMLCTQVLNGLLGSMKALSFTAGDQYTAVTVSFDPREKPELAASKKQLYVARYARSGAASGWHFLTGDEAPIKALTEAVGFHYAWDASTNQFAHASGIIVLTPDGRISRYFYGIDYAPRDLRLGLVEAGAGKIGSTVDQILLFCYHYDPATGKYGLIIMRLLRAGAVLTLVALAAFFLFARRRSGTSGRKWQASQLSVLPFFLLPVPFAPEQASTFAPRVDNLYLFLICLTIFFAVLIAGCEFYFAIKYRRRSPDEIPPKIEGAMKLEIAWTVIPFIIAMFIFVWGASIYFSLYRAPKEALEIFVTAKQWMWRAQHPDGQREINELHIPVNRRVKLTMASEDVIHSYFVPAFRTKTDVVPGRYTTTWFEPTKAGRYHLFCAEYCGTSHSKMIGTIVVLEPAEYEAWLSGGPPPTNPATAGGELFASFACNSCHREEGTGRGPWLGGLFGKTVRLASGETVVADEAYIRESIFNPRARLVAGYPPIMPTFQGLVGEEQVMQLIAYIKSIGPKKEGAALGQQSEAPKASPTTKKQ
jgi:cytochrome c oxidase subunit II